MVPSIVTSNTSPFLRLQGQPSSKQAHFTYQLVAKPNALLADCIKDEQHWFFDDYLEGKRNQEEPVLTFCSFSAFPEMEETINRWLQRICCQQAAFSANLVNYGGFPPQSIFMRAQPSAALDQLSKGLKAICDYVVQCGCPAPRIYAQPRLFIAQNLPEPVYNKALFNYAQRDFKAEFLVEELFLLKRQFALEPLTKSAFFRLPPQA